MRIRTTVALASLSVAVPALAQHSDDYESKDYTADADGEVITGQPANADNPYYVPPVAQSHDGLIVTYAGNTYGIPANPAAGANANFVLSMGTDPALTPFARSQRDVPYKVPGGKVKVAYDLLVTKIGPALTSQNVGSFSTQSVPNGAIFGHIDLVTWVDPNNAPAGWNGTQVWFDAADVQLQENIPQFMNLTNGKWYRRSSSVDLDLNQILKVQVTDKETGEVRVHDAVGRFADGGAAGGPIPVGFRYFAGCAGGTCSAGNTIAWDNLIVTCYEDIDEDGMVGFSDVLEVLSGWGPAPNGHPADLDKNLDVGFSDLLTALARWGACVAP
jgi:hypothetical protein